MQRVIMAPERWNMNQEACRFGSSVSEFFIGCLGFRHHE